MSDEERINFDEAGVTEEENINLEEIEETDENVEENTDDNNLATEETVANVVEDGEEAEGEDEGDAESEAQAQNAEERKETVQLISDDEPTDPVVEPDIQDLYGDYSERLDGIEDNRYFRYLYEMVRAGENKFTQSNQILHKVVDESWLITIEESLDAINRIINKPRKFITTREEVVPVGLAKKISADSIKHLSKNTQFIASEPGEPVMPTKILNSQLEETYDLYENRFIYHLIQRLVRFIDKRTDVIFWATGDETRNKMVFESQVDDAYEQISYKIEMTIKNLQSFAENDSNNMAVFARIDRLRRLVMSIRASSFCSIMAGCAQVRSPIQRTNLMIKDPDYRTCYRLWHFLENYDDVGYTIEVLDNTMAIDDEYVSRMYTNLVSEYTTFKSIIETDDRELSDELRKNLLEKSKKEMKPKFIKEIQEEIVENRDLPDVEIRRVFVEEVTEAQLAAEARAEQAEKDMLAAQEAQKEAERQARDARYKAEEAEDRAKEATDKLDFMSERTEKFRVLADNAEKARVAAEAQAVKDVEAAKKHADEAIGEIRAEADKRIADNEAEKIATVNEARANAEAEIAKNKAETEAEIAKVNADTAAEIARNNAETEARINKTNADTQAEIIRIKSETDNQIATARADAEAAVNKAQTERTEASEARAIAEEKAARYKKNRETAELESSAAKREAAEAAKNLADVEAKLARAEKKLDVAEKLKESAESRAQQKVYAAQSEMANVKDKYDAVLSMNIELEKRLKEAQEEAKKAQKALEKERKQYEAELEKERNKGKLFKKLSKK